MMLVVDGYAGQARLAGGGASQTNLMNRAPVFAANKVLPPRSPGWLGGAEHTIAKNQLVNRTIVETLGYTFWAVLFARNGYERLERLIDWGMWTAVGTALLPGVNHLLNQRGIKALQRLGVKQPKALQTPFERLEQFALTQPANRARLAQWWGLRPSPRLNRQLNTIARQIVRHKLLVIATNLLLLGAKGQLFYWGKNVVTQRLSGKSGFVGEFNIAQDAYLNQKAATEKRTERMRQIISIAGGVSAIIAGPLWIAALLKAPVKAPMMGTLKKLLPHYNYQDALYLGKAVLIFHNLLNWMLPSILSARDNHERREVITKNLVFDFFFLIGDELISAKVAQWLLNRPGIKRHLGRYRLLKPGRTVLGLPHLKRYSTVLDDVARRVAPPLALKLSRIIFWSGVLGTALGMGITTTLVNNWYTQRKVLEEQAKLIRPIPPKSPHSTPAGTLKI